MKVDDYRRDIQIIGKRPCLLRDLWMISQAEHLQVVHDASVWILHYCVEAESLHRIM